MLRSFSKELAEDREFEIGGEVFRFVYPHWKEGALLFDDEMEEVKATASGTSESNGAFSFVADTETAIKRIPMMLDPDFNDAHARFEALVARKKDPVPRHQIAQAYRWLVEVTSGFPTTPPSDFSAGDGTSESSLPEG